MCLAGLNSSSDFLMGFNRQFPDLELSSFYKMTDAINCWEVRNFFAFFWGQRTQENAGFVTKCMGSPYLCSYKLFSIVENRLAARFTVSGEFLQLSGGIETFVLYLLGKIHREAILCWRHSFLPLPQFQFCMQYYVLMSTYLTWLSYLCEDTGLSFVLGIFFFSWFCFLSTLSPVNLEGKTANCRGKPKLQTHLVPWFSVLSFLVCLCLFWFVWFFLMWEISTVSGVVKKKKKGEKLALW